MTDAERAAREAERAREAAAPDAADATSAKAREERRAADAARRRRFAHLPRGKKCGVRKVIGDGDPDKGDGFAIKTRCGCNTGCPYCRAWNKDLWKERLELKLSALVDAYVWHGAQDDSRRARERCRDARGQYACIQQPGGQAVLFSSAGFSGAVKVSTEDAIKLMRAAIDRIPDGVKRLVNASRGEHGWALNARKKSRFKCYGKLQGGWRRLLFGIM
jgi:hypothetical protein